MPKKKHQETQAEQSERFKRDAQRLIDAGELNLSAATAALERLVAGQKKGNSGKSE